MHFSQALLAFAAVAAAGVIPVPRDTYELEERGNELTARDAIEFQADAEIASASDEEIPELEPRTTAAAILVKDDIEDLEVRQKNGKKGGNSVIVVGRDAEPTPAPILVLEVRQSKGKKGGNSVIVVGRDAEPTPAPALVKDDLEDLEARQGKGGKKGGNSVIVVGRDAEPTAAPVLVLEVRQSKGKKGGNSVIVVGRDPEATPVPVLEEADGEELEARQAKAVAGVVSGLKNGGKAPAPKAPAAVRNVDPLQTPAPVLERDAAEEDDAEELEARATVAAGGSKPKSAQAGGSPKSAQAGGSPKSAVVKEVDAQPTPAPVLERQTDEEDDTEELEARATVAAGGSKPKSAQAGGSPKSAQVGGQPKSAVVKAVDAQPTPAPELDEREEDDAEELEARATAAVGGAGKPKASPASGATKGKPSVVIAGRAECTGAQIVKREFQTVYVPVTRVVVERQPRETVFVV